MLASHPAHLVSKDNSTVFPSALIPFCAFNTQLGISDLVTLLPGEKFPVLGVFDRFWWCNETLNDSTWFNSILNFKCSFSSKSVIEHPYPVCTSFLPASLEGQLRYKLTLNRTSYTGRRNGLVLLLDINEDRSVNSLDLFQDQHAKDTDPATLGGCAKMKRLVSYLLS